MLPAAAQGCKSLHDAEGETEADENLPLNDVVLIAPQSARVSVRPLDRSERGYRLDFQVNGAQAKSKTRKKCPYDYQQQ